MLTVSEISQFILEDDLSEKKQRAKVGQKYYDGRHDILDYRFFYYDTDGVLQEDKTRSNVKIPHSFFTELTDQQVQYMLSGDGYFVKSDLPELQNELDEYFNENEDFSSELYELLTNTVTKGFGYMFAYKNEEDRTAFQCADTLGVVEVRAKDTDDKCEYVIYWYVDRIEKGKKKIKRIQVWDKQSVHYFTQDGEGKIEKDDSVKTNPRPHTLYKKVSKNGKDDGSTYYENFGFIPFFRLDNGKKQVSGLRPIKELIDDYDLMASSLSNNLIDFDHPLFVVNGFQGDNLEELQQNVKTKKLIGIPEGEHGGVDIKTVDVPFQARSTKLALDETNIYRFGMGFNSAQIGDGNITNIVIKSRYALLDLKCNKLEIHLKQFMRKILKVVLKEINDKNGTDYQLSDVYFNFEREVMTNAQDNAAIEQTKAQTEQVRINTLLNLANTLDNETIVQGICEILDLDYEELQGKLPPPVEEEAAAAAMAAAAIPTEEPPAIEPAGVVAPNE
jgi:SPP1 family phage portal protein